MEQQYQIERRTQRTVSHRDDQNRRIVDEVLPGYPSIGDQLDMLWHAIDEGKLDKTSDFYKSLKTVKDNHPKG